MQNATYRNLELKVVKVIQLQIKALKHKSFNKNQQ
jgi:hypothetical protein